MAREFASFPPQIFISYTKRDLASEELAQSLLRDLTDAGFAVFFDQALLEVGEDWRAKLDEALFECDGGVILLSGAALESGWVKKEATILRSRKAVGVNLPLLPVFLGGAGPGDLAGYEWEPVDLESIQGLEKLSNTEIPARVVAVLEQRFDGWASETPDKERQRLMVGELVGVDAGNLRYLLSRMPRQRGDWGLSGNPTTALARKLASRFADMPPKKVARNMRHISRWMKKTQAELLVNLAAVYWVPRRLAERLWEDGEAARLRIGEDPKGHEQLSLIAVDSDSTDAAQMCVHRASGRLDDWSFVAVGNRVGEHAYEELEEEILEALDDAGIYNEDLAEPSLEILPLVIAIPKKVAPAVAERLRERFRCAFLMLCDQELVAKRETVSRKSLWMLAPLEGAGQAVLDRVRANDILGKLTYKE